MITLTSRFYDNGQIGLKLVKNESIQQTINFTQDYDQYQDCLLLTTDANFDEINKAVRKWISINAENRRLTFTQILYLHAGKWIYLL